MMSFTRQTTYQSREAIHALLETFGQLLIERIVSVYPQDSPEPGTPLTKQPP
jgi:hypothetical protein